MSRIIRILITTLSLAALGVLLVAPVAEAGLARTHDGFFLRLSGGFGIAGTSVDVGGEDLKAAGGTGDVNFAIGGSVARNFALHASFWGWLQSNPSVELGDIGGTLDGNLGMQAFGGGATYYFMPVNMYLSGSVGVGTLRVDIDGGPEGRSEAGLVLDFTLGKEWWVGNSWGIGLAGALGVHSIPEDDLEENWSGPSFGLRFTATMN
jgi:hypothetical protein